MPCLTCQVKADFTSISRPNLQITTQLRELVVACHKCEYCDSLESTAAHRWVPDQAPKDICGTRLSRGGRQLVSSLTWRKHMRHPGNMVSSKTFTELAAEADSYLCVRISQGSANLIQNQDNTL